MQYENYVKGGHNHFIQLKFLQLVATEQQMYEVLRWEKHKCQLIQGPEIKYGFILHICNYFCGCE
jgi:hypothetical protein